MKPFSLFLTILAVVMALACSRTEQDKAFLNSLDQDDPAQEASNVRFVFSEKALNKAQLEAPHVVVKFINGQEVSIFDQGLHLKFFTPEGTLQSDLTANYGEFRKEFGQALVSGNVVVINEKGDRIETEKLEWDSEKDSIFTREFVKVYTENEIIYGDGIRAKSDFSSYKFYNIRGTMKLSEGAEPDSASKNSPAGGPR